MKKSLAAMFVALLMVGCGEDIEVPKLIKCDGCKKEVSSSADDCPNCGHPIADSVDAYLDSIGHENSESDQLKAENERLRAELERMSIQKESDHLESETNVPPAWKSNKLTYAPVRKLTNRDAGNLRKRGDLFYYRDETVPFTGFYEGMSNKGFPWDFKSFKDGKLHGEKWEKYVVNGQMAYIHIYDEGLLISAKGWHPNGKPNKTKVTNGNGVTYELDIFAHTSRGLPGTRIVSGPSGDLESDKYKYEVRIYKDGVEIKK